MARFAWDLKVRRTPSFNRPTTARPGAASTGSQTVKIRERAAKTGVPASSSASQGTQSTANRPSAVPRSTAHNYFPGIRPGRELNANRPQAARAGQRKIGTSVGVLPGLSAGTANVGRPGTRATARPGQSVDNPGPAPVGKKGGKGQERGLACSLATRQYLLP